jgi:PIN domain nuclease of toxin-antitoxin system
MNLLLDTHALLWWLNDDSTLSEQARASISDGSNVVFISAASIWEIRIKQQFGKLEAPSELLDVLVEGPYLFLDITSEHAYHVGSLPLVHRDPFDRLLISQAQIERLTVVSRDPVFQEYEVSLLRA